jgi:hypothetical protein
MALKGVSQEKWGTLFTLFSKYGPIPRLLLQYFLPPGEYGTGMVEESLQAESQSMTVFWKEKSRCC